MIKPDTVPHPIAQPNNMGMVRYFLALAVVIAHFGFLTGRDVWFPMSSYSAVGGFFALSGFLIYGSYIKSGGFVRYIYSRMRRLLPAYWLTVTVFAVLLSLLSVLPASEYFASAGFWEYMGANLSLVNFLHPPLPGVFSDLNSDVVNGSLWTMKVEWALYLSVPVVFRLIGWLKCKSEVMFVAIYVLAVVYRLLFNYLYNCTGNEFYEILERQFFGQMSYFYIGVLIYFYFSTFMRYRWWLLAAAIAMSALADYVPYHQIIMHPLETGVLVLWFSMVGRWGTFEYKSDNFSYNLYLIHFPVIQILVATGCLSNLPTATALAIAIGATVTVAYAFNIVERRIIALFPNPKKR